MLKQLCLSSLLLSFVVGTAFAADSGVNGKWSLVQEGNEGCPTKLEISCTETRVHILTSQLQSGSDEAGNSQTEMDTENLAADVGSKTSGYHTVTASSDATSCARSESETDSYQGGGAVTLRTTDKVQLSGNGVMVFTHHVSSAGDVADEELSCTYERELF